MLTSWPPGPWVTWLGKKVFSEEIKLKWGPLGGPWSNMTVSLWKGYLETDTNIEECRRWRQSSGWCFYKPKKDEDCQQTPETRGAAWNRFSLIAFSRNQRSWQLELRSLASRIMGKYFLVVETTEFVFLYHSNRRKLICHPSWILAPNWFHPCLFPVSFLSQQEEWSLKKLIQSCYSLWRCLPVVFGIKPKLCILVKRSLIWCGPTLNSTSSSSLLPSLTRVGHMYLLLLLRIWDTFFLPQDLCACCFFCLRD